jgi:hypothetical protein
VLVFHGAQVELLGGAPFLSHAASFGLARFLSLADFLDFGLGAGFEDSKLFLDGCQLGLGLGLDDRNGALSLDGLDLDIEAEFLKLGAGGFGLAAKAGLDAGEGFALEDINQALVAAALDDDQVDYAKA